MMLPKKFHQYYQNRTADSLNDLIHSFESYNFESYKTDMEEIFSMYFKTESADNAFELQSNGSTGKPKKFLFGPNCRECIEGIEGKLRMRDQKSILIWNPSFGQKSSLKFKISNSNSNKMDFEVVGEWSFESHIIKLISFIDDCFKEWGKVNLVSLPHIWLCITTNKLFRGWAQKNSHKIAFVNSDCDASFKKIPGVHHIDQMIDWSTGINFYTCFYGRRHFLPIFFKEEESSYNLLNLTQTKFQIDDELRLGEKVITCECGKKSIEFNFFSHKSNRIIDKHGKFIDFEGLFDLLESQFLSLQIHQNLSGRLSVFYSSREDVKKDLDTIHSYLRSKNLDSEISFIRSKYFQIGRKRPPFWLSEQVNLMPFWERKRARIM